MPGVRFASNMQLVVGRTWSLGVLVDNFMHPSRPGHIPRCSGHSRSEQACQVVAKDYGTALKRSTPAHSSLIRINSVDIPFLDSFALG